MSHNSCIGKIFFIARDTIDLNELTCRVFYYTI